MLLPVLGGSFTCTVEINKLAHKLDNASAALFHNQTVKRQQLYLAAGGDWHGHAAVFPWFCWLPETRRSGPSSVQKQPHPARAAHCFHCTTVSGPKWQHGPHTANGSTWHFSMILKSDSTSWPGNVCYTSPVGVLMSLELLFHVCSWRYCD